MSGGAIDALGFVFFRTGVVTFGMITLFAEQRFPKTKTMEKVRLLPFDPRKLGRHGLLVDCGTGHQAWFYMKVNWFVESEGEEFTFDGIRTTGVLENEPDGWKIVQIHTSMPVKGQAVKY